MKFGDNKTNITTSRLRYRFSFGESTQTYRKSFQPRDQWRSMTLMHIFFKKLRTKVGLAGYDILFAYLAVEPKSEKKRNIEWRNIRSYRP